jgi:hypothetical protein
MLKRILFAIAFVFTASNAFAQNGNIFTDPEFGDAEFEQVSEDLGAAFVHTTNSGGSNLGKIWGVEAGIVAGVASADNLQRIAEEVSGENQDDLAYLPYAGLIAGVAMPFGIGAEVSMVPEIDLEDGAFSNFSAAVRWSITDMIPLAGSFSPVKIVTHLAYGSTEMDYRFSLSGSSSEDADFSIENTEFGVTAGFNAFIVEPYLGLSTVRTSSRLTATTDYQPLPPGFDPERNFKTSFSGARVKAGLLLKLPFMRIGAEASTLNSLTRYTLKLSLKI